VAAAHAIDVVADGSGGDVSVLLSAMMRLRVLAARHLPLVQHYYGAYLAGALRTLLLRACEDISPADPMQRVVKGMADAAAALGASGGAGAEVRG
jgi:hypothetical protein